MLVKIQNGIGQFGKLWTGTRLRPAHEDAERLWDGEKAIYNIVDAVIVERKCECGRSTRKFKARAVECDPFALPFLRLPVCFITAGGVGSIVDDRETDASLKVHNWSGRVGGHVIVNPALVLSGYVEHGHIPGVVEPYTWIQTYSGSTLSEYVMIKEDQGSHSLPIVALQGECPICRENREQQERRANLTPLNPAVLALVEQAKVKACLDWRQELSKPHTEEELLHFLRNNINWIRDRQLDWQSLELPESWKEVLNATN